MELVCIYKLYKYEMKQICYYSYELKMFDLQNIRNGTTKSKKKKQIQLRTEKL